jgi:hypothetical protein
VDLCFSRETQGPVVFSHSLVLESIAPPLSAFFLVLVLVQLLYYTFKEKRCAGMEEVVQLLADKKCTVSQLFSHVSGSTSSSSSSSSSLFSILIFPLVFSFSLNPNSHLSASSLF